MRFKITLSDVIKIEIFFLNTRVLAPFVPIPRAPKNYIEPPKRIVTSEMDKDEIEIVDKSPKLPTRCELRHACLP